MEMECNGASVTSNSRRQFNERWPDLIRAMDPKGCLLTILLSRGVLCHRDVDVIRRESIIEDMNAILLEFISKKEVFDDAYEQFITALRSSDQEHVANILTMESGPNGNVHEFRNFRFIS